MAMLHGIVKELHTAESSLMQIGEDLKNSPKKSTSVTEKICGNAGGGHTSKKKSNAYVFLYVS